MGDDVSGGLQALFLASRINLDLPGDLESVQRTLTIDLLLVYAKPRRRFMPRSLLGLKSVASNDVAPLTVRP